MIGKNISISRFQHVYDMIINESKNIPIPDDLANDIIKKFNYKAKIVYRKPDLIRLNKNYYKFSKNDNFTLTVFVINPEDIADTFNKSEFKEFIDTTEQDLKYGLSTNYGIYVPLRNKNGYLIINYDVTKENLNNINSIIKHELTHYFENTQHQSKWNDLISKDSDLNNLDMKKYLATMALTFKYNMNGSDIYYLTSGKEFEAFCASIEDHKNEFDKNILKNLIQEVIAGNINNQPKQLRNLYLFMFVNMIFDDSGERIKYIRKHLE